MVYEYSITVTNWKHISQYLTRWLNSQQDFVLSLFDENYKQEGIPDLGRKTKGNYHKQNGNL